jgi:hypothetical protein
VDGGVGVRISPEEFGASGFVSVGVGIVGAELGAVGNSQDENVPSVYVLLGVVGSGGGGGGA